MQTEKEIKCIELATIYELRLVLADMNRKEFTIEEIGEILDNFAKTKKNLHAERSRPMP